MSTPDLNDPIADARRPLVHSRPVQLAQAPMTDSRRGRSIFSVRPHRIPALAFATDLVVLVVVCAASAVLRRSADSLAWGDLSEWSVLIASPLIIAVWLLGNVALGAYRPSVLDAGTEEFRRVAGGALAAVGIVGAGCFLFQFPLSRGFLAILLLVATPTLLLARLALRFGVVRSRRRGALRHRVLVAGDESNVDAVTAALHREPGLGFEVVGAALPTGEQADVTPAGVPVVSSTHDLAEGVNRASADVVFLATGSLQSSEFIRDLMWELEDRDVQLAVAPAVSDVARDRVRVRPVGGLPLVHIDPPRGHRALRWSKRAFDLIASGTLILVAAPIFAVAALSIRRHDGGPVFFRQQRVGRDGTEFWCLKFRTMVVDAERLLADLRTRTDPAELFKLKDDPRITRPGAWLRRYSVDELPQLLNVWRGEMSLVGPRPPLREEVDRYPAMAHRRLRVRPGLTGLWQVSGRSDLSFEDAIRLDLYYVDNWSVFQDVSILWRTVGAVLGKKGAY